MRVPGVPFRIVVAALVLVLALVGLVVREGAARQAGQEVLLPLRGYDPRSLLSGHYVLFRLGQDQSSDAPCPPGADGFTTDPKGWVAISRRGRRHVAAGAAASREDAAKLGDIVLRGHLTCIDASSTFEAPGRGPVQTPMVRSVVIDIGIDRIYVDQAEAQAIEAAIREPGGGTEAFAVISAGRDGRARLKGLVVGDRRIDLDWF